MTKKWPQWYALVVGALFVVGVGISFIVDTVSRGVSLETPHKLSHIAIGVWGLFIFRNVQGARMFCMVNAVMYGSLAMIGFFMPDFLGLDAFNRLDTSLHAIVAGVALVVISRRR